jgi:hypothetical protein
MIGLNVETFRKQLTFPNNYFESAGDCSREVLAERSYLNLIKDTEGKIRKKVYEQFDSFIAKHGAENVFYYNDIRVLSGTAGYLAVKDGLICERVILIRS